MTIVKFPGNPRASKPSATFKIDDIPLDFANTIVALAQKGTEAQKRTVLNGFDQLNEIIKAAALAGRHDIMKAFESLGFCTLTQTREPASPEIEKALRDRGFIE